MVHRASAAAATPPNPTADTRRQRGVNPGRRPPFRRYGTGATGYFPLKHP